MRAFSRLLGQTATALRRLFAGRRSRPEDIPKKLTPQALQAAMQEARFLHARHAVDVRYLEPGEEAGMPRRADGGDDSAQDAGAACGSAPPK